MIPWEAIYVPLLCENKKVIIDISLSLLPLLELLCKNKTCLHLVPNSPDLHFFHNRNANPALGTRNAMKEATKIFEMQDVMHSSEMIKNTDISILQVSEIFNTN